jgi:N4-gp56 family major capsid protein
MANTTITTAANFIPEFWANEAIHQRQNLFLLANTVRQDWRGQILQSGDTVHFPKFSALTVQTKSAGTELTAQADTASKVTVTIDQHKAVPFEVDDIADTQSQYDLIAGYAKQGALSLNNTIDAALAALIQDSTVTQSAGATNSAGVYQDITRAVILEARKLLNEANAPQEDRYLVISPTQEKAMLQIDNFTRANEYGNSDMIQRGKIGEIYGFNVIISNNLQQQAAVASSSGAAAIVGRTSCMAYHKDAFGLGLQKDISVKTESKALALSEVVVLHTIYGLGVLEPTLAVEVRTTIES